jgi:hypothetical protein
MESENRRWLFYEDEGWNLYSLTRISFIIGMILGAISWGIFSGIYFLLLSVQGNLLGNLHAVPIMSYPFIYLLGLMVYWIPKFQNDIKYNFKKRMMFFTVVLVPFIGNTFIAYLIVRKYNKKLLNQPYQTLLLYIKASPNKAIKALNYMIKAPFKAQMRHSKAMKKEEYRKKVRNYTFYMFLAIIGISFIWSFSTTTGAPANNQSDQTPNGEEPPQIEYTDESLSTLKFQLLSSDSQYTELQKEEMWESRYKGKWINGTLYAHSVDKTTFGEYIVLAGVEPEGEYDIGFSSYRVIFKSSEKDELLQISPNEQFSFQGKLADYGGISSDITIKQAEITK